MNVRRVVEIQSFMSDGSFLGNKIIKRFTGFRQKVFSDVCQDCFLSCPNGKGAKTTFLKSRRNIVEMYCLEDFAKFELKKPAALSKFLSTCPKYVFWLII